MIEQIFNMLTNGSSKLWEDLSITIGSTESELTQLIFNVINSLPDWIRFLS